MKTKQIILFFAIIILFKSYALCQYSITGKTQGFKDSIKLYLTNMSFDGQTIIDSTIIINNNFLFKGTLPEPIIVQISGKGYRGQQPFWLDNSDIYIEVNVNEAKNAKVTGSKIKKQFEKFDSLFKLAPNENKRLMVIEDFVKMHPDYYSSIYILYRNYTALGKDKTKLLYSLVENDLKETRIGQSIYRFINVNRIYEVGDTIKEIKLRDFNDNWVSLSSLKGKYVLIDFWASWCGPCRKANIDLRQLYNQYKDKEFEIYGITLDENKKSWMAAVKKDSINWVTVSDFQGWRSEEAVKFGIHSIPSNVLIDKNGIIVAKNIGDFRLKRIIDNK